MGQNPCQQRSRWSWLRRPVLLSLLQTQCGLHPGSPGSPLLWWGTRNKQKRPIIPVACPRYGEMRWVTWEPCWSFPLFTMETVPFFLCLMRGVFSASKKRAWSPYSLLGNPSTDRFTQRSACLLKHHQLLPPLTRKRTLLLGRFQ